MTMRRWHKRLVVGVMAAGVLVPSGAAVADTVVPASTPATATAPATCTGDHQMLRLHDGTGLHHSAPGATATTPGSAYQHHSGPQDGTGPRANPPMDGSGNQWGRA